MLSITGAKQEGNAALAQDPGCRKHELASNVHVQNRNVESAGGGELARLGKLRNGSDDIQTELGQHVLDHQRHQGLVLDEKR